MIIGNAISGFRYDFYIVIRTSRLSVMLVQCLIRTTTIFFFLQTAFNFDLKRADIDRSITTNWATKAVSSRHFMRVHVWLAQCAFFRLASLKWYLRMLGQENFKLNRFWKPLQTVPYVFYGHLCYFQVKSLALGNLITCQCFTARWLLTTNPIFSKNRIGFACTFCFLIIINFGSIVNSFWY